MAAKTARHLLRSLEEMIISERDDREGNRQKGEGGVPTPARRDPGFCFTEKMQ